LPASVSPITVPVFRAAGRLPDTAPGWHRSDRQHRLSWLSRRPAADRIVPRCPARHRPVALACGMVALFASMVRIADASPDD
jgi:hypothetical protein